jgi:hypothetical protein
VKVKQAKLINSKNKKVAVIMDFWNETASFGRIESSGPFSFPIMPKRQIPDIRTYLNSRGHFGIRRPSQSLCSPGKFVIQQHRSE